MCQQLRRKSQLCWECAIATGILVHLHFTFVAVRKLYAKCGPENRLFAAQNGDRALMNTFIESLHARGAAVRQNPHTLARSQWG